MDKIIDYFRQIREKIKNPLQADFYLLRGLIVLPVL